MKRIPLYLDIDNLAEIFSLDRDSPNFIGLKQLLSRESNLIVCETEEVAFQNPYFESLSNELTSGDFNLKYRTEEEEFLAPPFKTNLHHHFKDKRSILFSYDIDRVQEAKSKTGTLLGGIGEEVEVYKKLNFKKDFFRGDKPLTIGKSFNNYSDFEPFILPFYELIINEPYLFQPDRKDWDVENYINNNFKPLMTSLLKKVKNKVNIVLCTFVNSQDEDSFPFFDRELENESKSGFQPLFDLCYEYLSELLGANRFKLWLIVSPMKRKSRHDRYALTNYQFIESGAGLAYFDDQGNFNDRGEVIHNYSIMHDEARTEIIPNILEKIQSNVIESVLKTHAHRIYGKENGNSYFLNFEEIENN